MFQKRGDSLLVVLGYVAVISVEPDIIASILVIGWEEDIGATERLSEEE